MSNLKKALGNELLKSVEPGMVLGLGSGTTVEAALRTFSEHGVREISFIPTSFEIGKIAGELGYQVLDLNQVSKLDWCFDGADEVDPSFNLLKGRGGAMLREKIVAASASKLKILVTEEKMVKNLGNTAVPVEVLPFALDVATDSLKSLGAESLELRKSTTTYGPAFSESGNLIIDVKFKSVDKGIASAINNIPGVVEHGLFFDFNVELYLASDSGVIIKNRATCR